MVYCEIYNRFRWFASIFAILVCVSQSKAAPAEVSFNRDIRPILSDFCFQCHGPDESKRQANLRLDQRDAAVSNATATGLPAIVSGDSEASELLRRIVEHDVDLQMPPPNSGKKLNDLQKQLLKKWIDEGAEYQGHWAFVPVQRPTLPDVVDSSWARNAIDRFVLSQLEKQKLEPAEEANRETLLRRVTLDLTGLPPTYAERQEYLSDHSPDAYEKVVDRLLNSKHYGERMAMQWLDYARYADSNGFQVDSSRYQWPWRDWVIQAFNDNMPFDEFTIEQLAGDLLPNPTPSQLVATGFNRNHRLNGEGGLIAEEWRVETVIDRVETTGMTWMALTLNCCRCHDHKYDPISQREFYQLSSFFNNVEESGILQGETRNTEPVLSVPTQEQQNEVRRLEIEIDLAKQHVVEMEKLLPTFVAAWEVETRRMLEQNDQVVWRELLATEVTAQGGAILTRQADGSYLASGINPNHDVYTIKAPMSVDAFSGLLLECFPDPSLPQQSLGRYPNGNFVLSSIEAEITAPSLEKPWIAKFVKAEATYSQPGWEIGLLLDDINTNGWAVDGPTRREPTSAMFLLETLAAVPPDATLTVRVKQETLGQHNIGRFRLSMTSRPPNIVHLDGAKFPEAIQQILAVESHLRTPDQTKELNGYFRASSDSPLKQAELALASLQAQKGKAQAAFANVMIMKEMPNPRDTFVLLRGEYDKHGEKVTAGFLSAVPVRNEGLPRNRLGLARWLVDPMHPLTSRVWVNRAWERFFGTGLVKTSENFGSQSDFPSHPELLDWLAAEFMQPTENVGATNASKQSWDMKHIQKLMVMSATYRQSSRMTKGQSDRDPDNRWLARGPRFRLTGEILRDQALAVSGLWVNRVGGPSVRPYMPEGVWDETSRYGDLRGYQHDKNEGLYRRTMYTIWKRTAAPPSMLLFDAPSREVCTVKRSRTNTPLQALSLLNEVTYFEAARKLAERILTDGGESTEQKIRFGFELVTSREPSEHELSILNEGYLADLTKLKDNDETADTIVCVGDSPSSPELSRGELAAFTLLANVLLNLDEVITRE